MFIFSNLDLLNFWCCICVVRFLRHVPVVYVDYPGETSLKQIYGTFNRAMLRMIPALRSLLLLIYSFSVIFLTSAFLHLFSVHFFTPSLLFYCSSPFHSSLPHLLTCLQDVRGASDLGHGGVLPALPGQVHLLIISTLFLPSFSPHLLTTSPPLTPPPPPGSPRTCSPTTCTAPGR